MTAAEQELVDALGEWVVEKADGRQAPWFRIALRHWGEAPEVVRAHGYTYFSFLSGMDWLPNPSLDGEHAFDSDRARPEPPEVITDPAVRVGGGSSRFQVFAHLANVTASSSVTLCCDIDVKSLAVPTWTDHFAGALWHERETWEMFGFDFVGHPGLRHIYLPEEFSGHPLRKDYPLLAREVRPWPGLVDMEEMPKDPEPGPAPEEDTQ